MSLIVIPTSHFENSKILFNVRNLGVQKMAQWLSALAALPADLTLVLSIYDEWRTNSITKVSNVFLCSLRLFGYLGPSLT